MLGRVPSPLPAMPSEPTPAVPPSLPPATPRTGPAPPPLPPGAAGAPGSDPNETMFFQRRAARKIHLLPSLVLAGVVLGSGALVTWALTRKHQPVEAASRPVEPAATQPVLSPEEGRRAANPVVSVAATPTPAGKPTPEVRRAQPVDSTAPPSAPASFEEANAAPLNTNLAAGENAQAKADVLARVDLMPEVTQDNKDKLYAAVDRARGMGRMITLPFEKGRNTVADTDVEKLRRRTQAPDIKRFTDDPTVVFVILGYADQKGDPKVNYDLSLKRARSVLDALRDRCGFQNVMHAVAMGGSSLFGQGQKEADKNRVVEVWAVLP